MIPRRRWRKEFSSSMDMYAFAGISSSPGALPRLSLRAAHASSSSVKGKSMISPSKFLASSNSTFFSGGGGGVARIQSLKHMVLRRRVQTRSSQYSRRPHSKRLG